MTIRHSHGAYPVIFERIEDAFKGLPDASALITDDNVQAAWGHAVPDRLPKLVLPAGEATKCLARYAEALEWLASLPASRNSAVIALGGGVVGDLAGFVAASYMRGIRYVGIPTSLLAQVDSSVGGKVAVDLKAGKNLAGAFHPPYRVSICIETLDTLPAREFTNGMAEVCKYGFIMDRPLAERLASDPLKPADPRLRDVVERCIELKAHVVESDEFETTGTRAILNFGHTLGHAIELLGGYERYLHGEAIAIGMVLEARLGEALGITPRGVAESVEQCLRAHGLPTELEQPMPFEQLLHAMRRDKKADSGRLSFSLLTELGACKLVRNVDESAVADIVPTS